MNTPSAKPQPSIRSDAPDAEINSAIATHVQKWKWIQTELHPERGGYVADYAGGVFIGYVDEIPSYATSTDAVLLLLDRWPTIRITISVDIRVVITATPSRMSSPPVVVDVISEAVVELGQPLARCICLALLRAAGVQVVYPGEGATMTTDWVNCPVCGEPDMRREEHGEECDAFIFCVNHACASNGGSNADGLVTAANAEIARLKQWNADRAGQCAAIEQRLATRIAFFQEALITIAKTVDTSQTCSPGNELVALTAMDALARDERCWTEAERQWHEDNRGPS